MFKQRKSFTILMLLLSLFLIVSTVAAETSAPDTINTFTISPSSANIGTSVTFQGDYDVTQVQNAFCFYFASADAAAWASNFTSLGSIAGVSYTQGGTTICPGVPGYGSVNFYTTNTSAASFGDIFSQGITVPNIATGAKIVAVRQYEGLNCDPTAGAVYGITCGYVNYRSTSLTVLPASSTVYAEPSGACSGTPCYTSVQAAVNGVATGGTVSLEGNFFENVSINQNVTILSTSGATVTGSGGATFTINGGTVAIHDIGINGDGSNPAINVTGGSLTLRGNDIDDAGQAAVSNSGGTVVAYVNNITNSGAVSSGVSGTGTYDHNWWGSYTVQPANVSAGDWSERLGAAVDAYGIGSLGNASITGGTGTAVVVSHGRGSLNAPFDQATVADGNTQCSDYYDFFVQSGSGTWTVNMPIDLGTGCDSVYNNRKVFSFDVGTASCMDGSGVDPACWNSLVDNGAILTQVPFGSYRLLRWSGVTTAELQGTPLVSGNQDDLDPTAINLLGFGSQNSVGTLLPAAIGLSLLMGLSLILIRRRRA